MPCKMCGKTPKKKYFDRIYCRECQLMINEIYWKSKEEEDCDA